MNYLTREKIRDDHRFDPPNNWAIAIDGKIWKVFAPGKNQQYYLSNLCRRKTAETGKKWTLTPYAGGL